MRRLNKVEAEHVFVIVGGLSIGLLGVMILGYGFGIYKESVSTTVLTVFFGIFMFFHGLSISRRSHNNKQENKNQR